MRRDILSSFAEILDGHPNLLDRRVLYLEMAAISHIARMSPVKPRIMYIEPGGGLARVGGRIGRVAFSKSGKTLRYSGRTFETLGGRGYKANYYDVETGIWCWISGPRHDGNDALYPMTIGIDDDVRDEYWCQIRKLPDNRTAKSFRSPGKYSRRKPRPELSVSGGTRNGGNRGGSGARRR